MKFYIKNSKGRYEEYADQWEGFPANGWWFVGEGRQNLVVPIDSPRPLEKLKYLQHRNEIAERLSKMDTRQFSLYSLVEETLSLLEEIVNEDHQTV